MPADPLKTSTTTPSDGPTTAPTISVTALDWRVVIAAQWQTLGFELLGFGSTPRRTMGALRFEWETLVAVIAWFEAHCNITKAAEGLRTGRKVVRVRVAAWRKCHPNFVGFQTGPKTRIRQRRKAQKDSGQARSCAPS